MKETMSDEKSWRTVQMFLTSMGIYEVEVNLETQETRCTCMGYAARSACAHANTVGNAARENGGVYPIKISSKATEEDAEEAQYSKEAFRNFVLKFGKVEVL
jgi:hypothetical protein